MIIRKKLTDNNTNHLITSSAQNFDFEVGDWVVKHRKLKDSFNEQNEWIEFTGTSSTRKVLGGHGNIEDNLLELPNASYRAIAVRSFDDQKSEWSIWWLDGREPGSLSTPVIGKFKNGVGRFYATEKVNNQTVKVRFKWIVEDVNNPRWEQAFSFDEGISWKTNWYMEFIRLKQNT